MINFLLVINSSSLAILMHLILKFNENLILEKIYRILSSLAISIIESNILSIFLPIFLGLLDRNF
jgi:hypothetical protein